MFNFFWRRIVKGDVCLFENKKWSVVWKGRGVFCFKKWKMDVFWKGVFFSEMEFVKSGVVKKKKFVCVEVYFCNCYVE